MKAPRAKKTKARLEVRPAAELPGGVVGVEVPDEEAPVRVEVPVVRVPVADPVVVVELETPVTEELEAVVVVELPELDIDAEAEAEEVVAAAPPTSSNCVL